MRKSLKRLISALAIAILATGCTVKLFANYSYDEKISSVLISQDKKKIVVIGDEYHYIFDAPPALINILESPIHNKVAAGFNSFKVTKDNAISGRLTVYFDEELTDAENGIAKNLGFKFFFAKPAHRYIGIGGARYSAKEFTVPAANNYKLNKPYIVSIEVERTDAEKLLRVPLTPVTLALDGAIVIGVVVLAPFAAVYVARGGR